MFQAGSAPDSSYQRRPPWLRPFFSLRWRLAFVYVALFGLFVAILSVFLYSSVSASLLRDGRLAFPQRVTDLRAQVLTNIFCQNETLSSAGNFLKRESMPNDIDAFYILDTNGDVLSSSNGDLLGRPFPYITPAFFTNTRSVFNSSRPFSSYAFEGTNPTGDTFDGLLEPLQPSKTCQASSFQGYLAATTSYDAEQATLNNLLFLIAVVATAMVVIGAALIVFFTGVMLSPLRHIIDTTHAIAHGNLKERVHLPQNDDDEISTLAASFNEMVDQMDRALEAERASEQRAQRFVSDASHELRTPITSLRGFTEVLMRGAKEDAETTQRVLSLMKNEAERMSRLVNDLLTLARLDEGRPFQTSEVDLVDSAIESVQQAKTLADEGRKVALDLATQERLKVQAKEDYLKQMLLILLDNAIKYGQPGPEGFIILRLDKQHEDAIIQVRNNGKGIRPEDLPHVFDRFYRGLQAPLSPTGVPIVGTGLGLSIAIAIARAHHGTITVTSEPGEETVFTVTLPCVE